MQEQPPPVFLTRAQVERRVGLRRTAIYTRMKADTFPRPVRDAETTTIWWIESEIEQWQRARIAERDMGRSMG